MVARTDGSQPPNIIDPFVVLALISSGCSDRWTPAPRYHGSVRCLGGNLESTGEYPEKEKVDFSRRAGASPARSHRAQPLADQLLIR